MPYRLAPILVCLLLAVPVRAQGNLEAERQSLAGIASFGVQTTVEGPRHLAESDQLTSRVLTEGITAQLRDAGLPVTSRPGASAFVHLHLNMMSLENRLVPFSAELGFLQDVRLRRNGSELSAVTWNESVLGLVSYDLLNTISSSVSELVDQFARDFEAANR